MHEQAVYYQLSTDNVYVGFWITQLLLLHFKAKTCMASKRGFSITDMLLKRQGFSSSYSERFKSNCLQL